MLENYAHREHRNGEIKVEKYPINFLFISRNVKYILCKCMWDCRQKVLESLSRITNYSWTEDFEKGKKSASISFWKRASFIQVYVQNGCKFIQEVE